MHAACIVLGALSLLALTADPVAEMPPQSRAVVLRAQPSVLKVLTSIDLEFKRPELFLATTGTSGASLLEEDYAAAAKSLPADLTKLDYCWMRIAEEPSRYLLFSGPLVAFSVTDELLQTGSGFVVDQAGTLLTNQHVIAVGQPPENAGAMSGYFAEDLLRLLREVVRIAGGPVPDALVPAIDDQVIPWLTSHYKVSKLQRHAVRLATHLTPGTEPKKLSIRPAAKHTDWRTNTVACDVAVEGEPFPGKDIAVLRAPSLASRLISLPLGDSSRFLLGSNVYALGFPAAAVEGGEIDEVAANYRVIAHDGIIDQRMPLQRGWEAFHMTAIINHGDSGGPVIDDRGRVVAINVAGNPRAAAQNLAIPIDLAKPMLGRVNSMPGIRNEVTTAWNAACDALDAGKHADALPLFEKVASLQGGWKLGSMSGGSQASDLIAHCRRELGLEKPTAGAAPRGLVPSLGKPQPLKQSPQLLTRVGEPKAEEDWLSATWNAFCQLNTMTQVMVGIVLLSMLVGLLKWVRSLF